MSARPQRIAGLASAACLLAPGAVIVHYGFLAGGSAGGVSALATVLLSVGLAARITAAPEEADAKLAGRVTLAALLALPGGLVVYLAFNGGGFFPGTTGFAALLVAVVLSVRAGAARESFVAPGPAVIVISLALAAYALWTLASAAWSDAPARALFEFDRVVLYLLTFVLFGTLAWRGPRLRWIVRGLAVGLAAVAVAALISRLLPDVWTTPRSFAVNRLAYPLSYSPAVGLVAVLGLLLCFHLTSDEREGRVARVLGATTVPALATTVLLTASRGPIVAGVAGLVAYVALARPRGLPAALLATLPPTIVALNAGYGADRLFGEHPVSPAAIGQGHDVAIVVGLCAVAAGVLRSLLIPLDRRLRRLRLRPGARVAVASSLVVALVAGVAIALAAGAPDALNRQYDRFAKGDISQQKSGDERSRLATAGAPERLDYWEVARGQFKSAPVRGHGAGTFELLWDHRRRHVHEVTDAHSVYLESLTELGVVGFAFVVIAIGATLGGLFLRARGKRKYVRAVVLAVVLAWALQAAIDWVWELPAISLGVFAVAGAALAREDGYSGVPHAVAVRAVVSVGAAALALIPSLITASQHELDTAVEAFQRDDCTGAARAAEASVSALDLSPNPYEVIGYCAARHGRDRLAVRSLNRAVERDPENWELRYGLALVRAAAGLDPRPAARAALRLNPRDAVAQDAVVRFGGRSLRAWRRAARKPLRSRLLVR